MQSEHWVSIQATLFISVVGYLKVEEWDKTDGPLAVGAEVTVNGVVSGAAVAPGSHWAKVVAAKAGGEYLVEDAAGETTTHHRRVLRHRVLVQQAFVAMSDDTKHDTYAMRELSEKEFAWFEADGCLVREKLTVLAQHSDNAPQVSARFYACMV